MKEYVNKCLLWGGQINLSGELCKYYRRISVYKDNDIHIVHLCGTVEKCPYVDKEKENIYFNVTKERKEDEPITS